MYHPATTSMCARGYLKLIGSIETQRLACWHIIIIIPDVILVYYQCHWVINLSLILMYSLWMIHAVLMYSLPQALKSYSLNNDSESPNLESHHTMTSIISMYSAA